MSVPLTSYGFTQPLIDIPQPIVAQRDPLITDKGLLGQIWVNVVNNSAYIATSLTYIPSTNRIETLWTPVGIGTGDVASFVTDAGNVNPVAGVVNLLGGSNINTTGVGNSAIFNLNDDVVIGGNFTTIGGNISLPNTDSGGVEGIIRFGGLRFINNIGTENTYIGAGAGNLSESGAGQNVGVGFGALTSITTGNGQVAIGHNALTNALDSSTTVAIGAGAASSLTSGVGNVIIGTLAAGSANCDDSIVIGNVALRSYTSTGSNVAIGRGCLFDLIDGINNLVISCVPIVGGLAYDGSQSDNLLIQNEGEITDNNVIRIGTQGTGGGQQDTCYIAGIIGNSVSNTELVTIDNVSGQLGTVVIEDFATSFVADTGTATPALGVLTIAGGTNISTTAAGSTVTINTTGPAALQWTTVNSATNMAVNTGYIVNGGATLQFTLPVNAAVGDIIEVVVLDTAVGGWQINQNANQYIIANGDGFSGGAVTTTVGVSGNVATIAATTFKDFKLICVITDTAFVLRDLVSGNITFT